MKYGSLLISLALLLVGCSSLPATASPVPVVETMTASLTIPILPSETLLPSPTATITIVNGTLKVQVNVRAGPGTGYESLGLLNANEPVQVTAQSIDGSWYQIIYPARPEGSGWISAQFVDAGGKPVPSQTAQVTPTASGPTGTVSQRLNVRSGPGTTYETMGILEPNTIVILTGKTSTGTWLQIIYPFGSTERGWVTAAYVQLESTSGLPVLNTSGTPVTPETDAGTVLPPMTPTPTIGPALTDNDSPANPSVSILFSSDGTHQFTYQSEVSIPEGDPEDWIEFTPYALPGMAEATMNASLDCSGNGTLSVELWQKGARLPNWGTLACGERNKMITLQITGAYQFRLRPADGEGLQLIHYQLTMRNNP